MKEKNQIAAQDKFVNTERLEVRNLAAALLGGHHQRCFVRLYSSLSSSILISVLIASKGSQMY